jgi:hypothetical protein
MAATARSVARRAPSFKATAAVAPPRPMAGYQVASWTGACASAGTNVSLRPEQRAGRSDLHGQLHADSAEHLPRQRQRRAWQRSGQLHAQHRHLRQATAPAPPRPMPATRLRTGAATAPAWGVQAQCYLTKIKADQTATVSFAPPAARELHGQRHRQRRQRPMSVAPRPPSRPVTAAVALPSPTPAGRSRAGVETAPALAPIPCAA